MFVAGEIVTVTAGPLQGIRVKLKESNSHFALLVEGCIPEYLVTGDFVVFAIHKETGCLYSQESWASRLHREPGKSTPVIEKIDLLLDRWEAEDKALRDIVHRLWFKGNYVAVNLILEDYGYIGPERKRIQEEVLEASPPRPR